jgi:2-C-methyl-D-erythritol 2,4-cyclodiphosphate synthase
MVRVGLGYDVHRFAAGRPLIIGGVEIAHERGLDGHSDADVLCHAIMDALLGAASMGDIGEHFPPDDDRWAGARSIELLADVAALVATGGWTVANVDAMVVMEAPKLAPHREEIRTGIAAAIRISPDAVGVKATTNEAMGFVGRGEGVAALAVAALERV